MRKQIAGYEGHHLHFTATVTNFGTRRGYRGPENAILLTNVRFGSNPPGYPESGTEATGHLWWTAGKWANNLKPEDRIEFAARIQTYLKEYQGPQDTTIPTDWSRPAKRRVQQKRRETL